MRPIEWKDSVGSGSAGGGSDPCSCQGDSGLLPPLSVKGPTMALQVPLMEDGEDQGEESEWMEGEP